jgi:hypothetical protein
VRSSVDGNYQPMTTSWRAAIAAVPAILEIVLDDCAL